MRKSTIENELLNPPDLEQLIESKVKQEGCPVCMVNGHIIWDIMIRGLAQLQAFNCEHCNDAVALVQFARDMVRVLKLNKQPEYPGNFQFWISQLAMLRLSDKEIVQSEILDKASLKAIEKIRRMVKKEDVEYAFCSHDPKTINKGTKSNVEPPKCERGAIVHNHPSGILEMSTPDQIVACQTDSVMCIIGENETKCYNCEGALVESIPLSGPSSEKK